MLLLPDCINVLKFERLFNDVKLVVPCIMNLYLYLFTIHVTNKRRMISDICILVKHQYNEYIFYI